MQLARVLDQHHPIARAGDLGQQSVGQCRLAGPGAASDEDVFARRYGGPQRRGMASCHGANGDIIVEGEDRDGGLTDPEGRRRDNRRQQPLETLSRLRQLGRDARALRMDLGADMVRHEADDPLAVGGGKGPARVLQPTRQPVYPEPAIGVELTSTIEGSSRKAAIAGPSAVRNIRAPREKASEWSGATATIVPVGRPIAVRDWRRR